MIPRSKGMAAIRKQPTATAAKKNNAHEDYFSKSTMPSKYIRFENIWIVILPVEIQLRNIPVNHQCLQHTSDLKIYQLKHL